MLSVRGVNRAAISGSFLISAFAKIDGERRHLGTEAILSRWHVEGCMNCQTHLEARAHFPIHPPVAAALDPESVEVELRTRGRERQLRSAAADAERALSAPRFTLRMR